MGSEMCIRDRSPSSSPREIKRRRRNQRGPSVARPAQPARPTIQPQPTSSIFSHSPSGSCVLCGLVVPAQPFSFCHSLPSPCSAAQMAQSRPNSAAQLLPYSLLLSLSFSSPRLGLLLGPVICLTLFPFPLVPRLGSSHTPLAAQQLQSNQDLIFVSNPKRPSQS